MGRLFIEDSLADERRMLAAGPLALALHVRALSWCSRHRAKGMLPKEAIPALVADFPHRDGWGEHMVKAAIWASTETGFNVHHVSTGGRAGSLAADSDSSVIHRQPPSPTTTPTVGKGGKVQDSSAPLLPQGAASSTRPSRATRNDVSASWQYAEWGTPAALAHLWNQLAPDNLPTVESLSGSRIQLSKALLRQFPEKRWWEEVFEQYRASRFLTGRAPKSKGHERFVADFDWMLRKNRDQVENAVRIHDGAFLD